MRFGFCWFISMGTSMFALCHGKCIRNCVQFVLKQHKTLRLMIHALTSILKKICYLGYICDDNINLYTEVSVISTEERLRIFYTSSDATLGRHASNINLILYI